MGETPSSIPLKTRVLAFVGASQCVALPVRYPVSFELQCGNAGIAPVPATNTYSCHTNISLYPVLVSCQPVDNGIITHLIACIISRVG